MKDINAEILNTSQQIRDLVDWLIVRHASPNSSPTMYIDLEGVNLCREGSLSIFTLLLDTGTPTKRVCLIDVHTLCAKSFDTAGVKGKSLKDILQDETIPKVFFDVRNDSDALFAHFGIALQGVEDVQLMESATRETAAERKFLKSLTVCVESDVLPSLSFAARGSWLMAQGQGERLFRSELGGSYDVFLQRPMSNDIIAYCVGDVQYLPELREKFWPRQTGAWRDMVDEETKKRVAESQTPEYLPHGSRESIAPWSKEQNGLLDSWS